MKTILKTSLFLSGVLLFIYGVGDLIGLELQSQFPYLILFFFLQSWPVAWLFYKAEESRWQEPIYSMGAISFRFLTGLAFILIVAFSKPPDSRALMLEFVAIYLVYMTFELYAVLSNLRRNSGDSLDG